MVYIFEALSYALGHWV